MSHIVFCTFDLKNANRQDYEKAYSELKKIGLEKMIIADNGNEVVIPTTSTIGKFNGSSATSLRDEVKSKVQAAFKNKRLDSEIFVLVGGNWAWGASTT